MTVDVLGDRSDLGRGELPDGVACHGRDLFQRAVVDAAGLELVTADRRHPRVAHAGADRRPHGRGREGLVDGARRETQVVGVGVELARGLARNLGREDERHVVDARLRAPLARRVLGERFRRPHLGREVGDPLGLGLVRVDVLPLAGARRRLGDDDFEGAVEGREQGRGGLAGARVLMRARLAAHGEILLASSPALLSPGSERANAVVSQLANPAEPRSAARSSFGVAGGWVKDCSDGRRVSAAQRVLHAGGFAVLRTREVRLPEAILSTHPPAMH